MTSYKRSLTSYKSLPMQKQSYRKLTVYQKAKELVLLVYRLTRKFPAEEKYTLAPQIRRAAISILANIVEGYSKTSKKDFALFLGISIGSATELELYLELSLELRYLSKSDFKKANSLLIEVKKMLYSFQRRIKELEGARL